VLAATHLCRRFACSASVVSVRSRGRHVAHGV